MVSRDIAPDSRLATVLTPRLARPGIFGYNVPIFCASCGAPGGEVPEENCTFAFYLCNPCFAKYGDLTTLMVMPDEVFWEEVRQAQLAKHGRVLTAEEMRAALEDPESLESVLARCRKAMTPHAGG